MVRSRTRTHSRQEDQRQTRETIDLGTSELHKRHSTRAERRRSGTICIRVLDGNQIDRLLWTDLITPEEHSVLTGFQLDAHRAGLIGPRAANLQRVSGSGHEISDKEAMLRLKHGETCKTLSVNFGPAGLSMILAVTMDDRPPARGDLSVLRQACSVLMEFRSKWVRPTSSRD